MHGWGGNAEMMLPLAAPLHAAGYSLLLVDARCHGLSDGDSFASLPRFAEDIEAALCWLARQPEVDPLALAAMMRRWLASKRIPFWPLGAYILAYVKWVIGHRFNAIAPCNTIAQLRCPVLIVHGLADDTVPVEEARQIFAARTNDAVELLLVPGSHDDYGDMAEQVGLLGAVLDRAFR